MGHVYDVNINIDALPASEELFVTDWIMVSQVAWQSIQLLKIIWKYCTLITSHLISQSNINCRCSSLSYTSTSSSWFSLLLYLIWFCCWTIKRKRIWCKNNCKWTICTMKNIGSQVYCWSLWNYDRWTLWDPLPVFNRYLKASLFFKNPPGDPIIPLMVPPCYHSPTTP